ncbi:MAG: class I SAM-dependent methyltransferase [Gammaproteobacteria bacterium]|nr:class I SAM-dependent methyltransferase [Gammaproteobacteria bacterium]
MRPVRYTPLHPQWFAFLDERRRLRWAAERARGVVLDIGCADQRIEPLIPSGCDVYFGLDIPARTSAIYRSRPDVYGDAERLPLRDGSVDTVMLMEVLEHLPDPAAALHDVRRVLRPGGRLVVSVPFVYPIHDAPWDFRRWTEYGLRQMADAAGYRIVELSHRGDAPRTGALLFNIGMAWEAAQAPVWLRPLALAFAALFTPGVNVGAWLASLGGERNPIMPYGYQAVLERREQASP